MSVLVSLRFCAVLTLVACSRAPASSTPAAPAKRPVLESSALSLSRDALRVALCRVLEERDRDCDKRITVRDAGTFPYQVRLDRGAAVTLRSTSEVSQLVTELAAGLKQLDAGANVTLDLARVHSDPVSYLEGRIQRAYFSALTRRIDANADELLRAAADEKVHGPAAAAPELCPELEARCVAKPSQPAGEAGRELFVYYPSDDAQARAVFEPLSIAGKLAVQPLPPRVTNEWMQQTTRAGQHGSLTLALDAAGRGRPFVVPGGRFNEMYGWDSFFITWGLLQDPSQLDLARAMVDNQTYEIEHYGKVLNANRSYYLTRSQPPFFAAMLAAVWRGLPHDPTGRMWLERGIRAALREYRTVWSAPPRRLGLCDADVCLARYYDEGEGEPPEIEPGAFAWFYQARAVASGACKAPGTDAESRAAFLDCVGRLESAYRAGKLSDRSIDAFFVDDRAVRESGHDTTFRWFTGGSDHCTDFATVDLNALLFRAETELATLIRANFGGTLGDATSAELCRRAEARGRLIRRYLWDETAGLFFDYDVKQQRRSSYVSATTLYPLWASEPNACALSLVTPPMAKSLRDHALAELEAPGGLQATSPRSLSNVAVPNVLSRTSDARFELRPLARQWEAPTGWAPHQMLAWSGLRSAGFATDAERLAYRWLYTIARNAADYHGTVPEKYDVVKRSHDVFQEYGNVGTEFSYIAEEGFGWMNASFLVGLRQLSSEHRRALRSLEPPEALWTK
jgi:alpha,alpha-trehalase